MSCDNNLNSLPSIRRFMAILTVFKYYLPAMTEKCEAVFKGDRHPSAGGLTVTLVRRK